MNYGNLLAILANLRDIAEQADRHRLSVWYPEFIREFPAASAVIQECALLPTATEAIEKLQVRMPALRLALALMPSDMHAKTEIALTFLYDFLRSKINEYTA